MLTGDHFWVASPLRVRRWEYRGQRDWLPSLGFVRSFEKESGIVQALRPSGYWWRTLRNNTVAARQTAKPYERGVPRVRP
jgi:hypothetical protein